MHKAPLRHIQAILLQGCRLTGFQGFGCDFKHLKVNLQEVATLARCQSENITQYYASVLKPGTSELLIVMELMAASVADLVGLHPQP